MQQFDLDQFTNKTRKLPSRLGNYTRQKHVHEHKKNINSRVWKERVKG